MQSSLDSRSPVARRRTADLRTFHHGLGVLVLYAVAAVTPGPGQVPGGWAVVAALRTPTAAGGLFLLHSYGLAAPVPVTGLTPDLSGAGLVNSGALSVVRRPWDGVLVVGESADNGETADVHFLTLNGTALASDVRVTLGFTIPWGPPTPPPSTISQLALLGDGSVLVATYLPNPVPAMAGTAFAIVTQSGLITPLPVFTNAGPVVQARSVLLDAAGTTMYFAIQAASPLGFTELHAAAFPAGGLSTPLGAVPGYATALVLDPSGEIIIATTSGLFRINPVSGVPTPLWTQTPVLAACAEPDTGYILFMAGLPLVWQSVLARSFAAGIATSVLSGPGMPPPAAMGMDLAPGIERIAVGSPPFLYTFQIAPNAGGPPISGNASFSLTFYAPTCSNGFFGISTVRAVPPLLVGGVPIHLDATGLIVLSPWICNVAWNTIPLPIPAIPSLAGAVFYVQTAHTAPAGIATSDALVVTIL